MCDILSATMFRNVARLEKALASLPEAMKPTKVDGRWRAPELSRRKIAELRKATLAMGRCAAESTPMRAYTRSPVTRNACAPFTTSRAISKCGEKETLNCRAARAARAAPHGHAMVTDHPLSIPSLSTRAVYHDEYCARRHSRCSRVFFHLHEHQGMAVGHPKKRGCREASKGT